VAVGTRDFLAGLCIDPGALVERAEGLRGAVQIVVFVAVDGVPAGLLGIADPIKPSTAEALSALHADGLRVVMLTGDGRTTAEAVARTLGLDGVIAGVLPDQKGEVFRRLRAEGRVVAMAGDGINDAPAPAPAQVGIAMGPAPTWPGRAPRSRWSRGTSGDRAGPPAQPVDDAEHPPEPGVRLPL